MEEREALIEDVLHLEINTILADGIQGKGMPPPRHALIDLAREYQAKLIAVDRERVGAIDAALLDDEGRLRGSRQAFAWARGVAADVLEHGQPTDSEGVILRRIKAHCAVLEDIFKAQPVGMPERAAQNNYDRGALQAESAPGGVPVPELALTQRDLAAIRKMWELGTDTVVMQTVVSLDGDVLNRIQREYAGEQFHVVHSLHAEAVKTSISTWRFLVKTVVGVVNSLLST